MNKGFKHIRSWKDKKMLTVNSNTTSLLLQNKFNKANKDLGSSLERLATGRRINKASDDIAGMAISTRLESRISGQKVGLQNANNAMSMLQVGEGGIDQIRGMLDRMRELATQSADATLSDADRSNADKEYQSLLTSIDYTAAETNFNGIDLLGDALNLNFQVGYQSADAINFITTGGVDSTDLALNGTDITTAANASTALDAIDAAIDTLNTTRSEFGAMHGRLERTISMLEVDIENTTAANSRIVDVDFASETANMTRNQILVQSSVALLSQANTAPQAVLSLLG